MKFNSLSGIVAILIQGLSLLNVSPGYDFFYFAQMWPGSYCDTRTSCCYPTTGKPATDFSIHGLWPTFNNGRFPQNCNKRSTYNETEISDLIPTMQKLWPTISCPKGNGSRFWRHEWTKHGTCSEANLNQHAYFEAALNIKKKVDLLQALRNAGIEPNGSSYGLEAIREAIKKGIGYTPVIECNSDAFRNIQLYQIYLCVDAAGSDLIECPIIPKRKCNSTIVFPAF